MKSSSTELTCCSFIIVLSIARPMPPKFICETGIFESFFGVMTANIFSLKLFPRNRRSFLSALRPQKV
ncbi:hypothetical protein D3C83_265810 [compost metagenome]